MSKYYKQKEKHEFSDEQTSRRKKLFLDKRVKYVLNCNECDGPLTQSESRRNGGICNNCHESI
jgi:hypothetical protein